MIVIPSFFYSGDVSIKEGATLTVWVPIGAINNSDDLNLEINLVDVTRVEPINSPILSCVNLKGNARKDWRINWFYTRNINKINF